MKIQSNGISINVQDQGARSPALVMLHYWGGSSQTWDEVVASLPTNYRTVRPDLRGWGKSLPDDTQGAVVTYSLDDFALDIMAVINTLALTSYVLVGHSMGGKVAQLIASRRPVGLAGLVLVAPATPSPIQMPVQALASMAAAYDSEESVGLAIDHMLTAKSLSPKHRSQVISDSLRGAPAAKAAWPQSTSHEDISDAVAAINVPTIVIAGELDRVDPVNVLKADLMTRIPHAELHVLEGTGHLSPLESPEAIAEVIVGFLKTLG